MQLTLGHTGITTSGVAMGCARIGSTLTPLSRSASVSLIEEAFTLGIRHFDTASIYGQGDSERFLGEALHRHRAQVCLSSKAGQRLSVGKALLSNFKAPIRWLAMRRGSVRQGLALARQQTLPQCFEPQWIERSLHASLGRLRTDHLDIFYLHSPNAAVLADERLMTRIVRLREEGLFRAFGVSCDDETTAWAAAWHPAVQVVQFAFNGSERGHRLLLELARLGKPAVLRGLMRDSARVPMSADALGQRFGQALHLPAFGGLIVGTTNPQHLRDNVAAFRLAASAAPAAFHIAAVTS